ncbi:glycopeptidase [Sulfolobus sp. E5-1-F]|uniref:peptide-N4-asparagine amidase n=1 Tax=Sulfolobaceae TaxID=118883 RepID=UPI001297BCEA|nr:MULTISPECIES: peptide-N4-asparagine amidase [unclassified Sulfolobus]QGA53318.1 glycopeptidase [Sulfolobus sp. E5-1-F]QGA68429.1 glycopeptidase [Sulfolobus sp. E11-6]
MRKSVALILLFSILAITIIMPIASSQITYGNARPLILGNITILNSGKIPYDPPYYSFEAYQIHPPNVTPVVIRIATNAIFNNSGLTPYIVHVNIPKGNYSMLILNVSINESNGAQYDRPVYIFANGVPIFWGSTQEFLNSTAEADLTMFENLLSGNVTFQLVLENFYDAKIGITGIYKMNVTLYLYPGNPPKGLPNYFIPLFLNKYNYSYVILNPLNDYISQNLTIPNGTYRMALLLYEEGGGLDELWYANEPATRETQVFYNNRLVGIVNPYQTIYTGGIDPLWWKPVTSINTLSFHTPYIIDLTPLLAISSLNNTIAVTVTNLETALQLTGTTAYDWDIAGVLMLWVNVSNPLISVKLLTAYSRFMDSSPIFNPGFVGEYYQEGGSYLLNYSAILQFKDGIEYCDVVQEGRFYAYQTFNQLYEKAYLGEKFIEYASESGSLYNATLYYDVYYPIFMQLSVFEAPISNPHVIPFNLSYAENGTLDLWIYYNYTNIFDKQNLTIRTMENVSAVGGSSGIIEVINRYGGAVLVSTTSNNAVTAKNLINYILLNGNGYKEIFSAEGLQNSTSYFAGYYVYYKVQFIPITNADPPNAHSEFLIEPKHFLRIIV